ncbi:MAG: adenylosuccinate lyase [Gammaproteobacteria bacterium]|jgi:adenylosuccinate lyase|nr:adenylosuccinate lyase [Gammaproteobacteria bacterium]
MNHNFSLTAISPLDGRYQHQTIELKTLTSEYGLMHYRLIVELKWLQNLSALKIKEIPALSQESISFLNKLIADFDETQANHIKTIESKTNHDVKAIEYYIKEKVSNIPELAKISEFVHFACTSEDINNLSYGLMMLDIRHKILLPSLHNLQQQLTLFAKEHANTPMLARTHGQVASPTTVGKEITNVIARLARQIEQLIHIPILGKINGAVGNYNAHIVAYPEIAWDNVAEKFVQSLGLTFNPLTTQIEPHDAMAEYFHCLMRTNTILIDFCRDVWGYISLGYFKQKMIAHEVGSSTMPHKVNPIDFENSEGNFGLANALFDHFAQKLPMSRWQRDLSDSTVLRNIGVACGHMLIALKSLQKGLHKIAVDKTQIEEDLNNNWEVLSEAIQTVMRRYHIDQPYEKLKELSRGKKLTPEILEEFINKLELPPEVKIKLKELTPATYIGLADKLV